MPNSTYQLKLIKLKLIQCQLLWIDELGGEMGAKFNHEVRGRLAGHNSLSFPKINAISLSVTVNYGGIL